MVERCIRLDPPGPGTEVPLRDGTVREPDRFAKMFPPSGLLLSLGGERYAQSRRTPSPWNCRNRASKASRSPCANRSRISIFRLYALLLVSGRIGFIFFLMPVLTEKGTPFC